MSDEDLSLTLEGESRKVWKARNWMELIWAGFLEVVGLEWSV